MGKVFALVQPQIKDKVLCLEIDVNDPKNEELLANYQIISIPTSVFIDKAKQIDDVFVGVIQVQDMLQKLQDLESK